MTPSAFTLTNMLLGFSSMRAAHDGRLHLAAVLIAIAILFDIFDGAVARAVGATTPFVGLFGTVWGIMNSFIGISEAHTTNLAVVAPGIAEALLATALGLIAAIPAVVIYNYFARSIAAYRALLGDASAQVLLLISRQGSLEGGRRAPRAARAAE